jgi:Protein of unknown function (DUF2523)
MPLFIAALVGALIQVAGTLVGRVLLSLGIGYAVYTGLDAGLSWLTSQVASSYNALPPQALQVMSTLRVGSAANILVSAISARLFLSGMTGGTIRKMVVK